MKRLFCCLTALTLLASAAERAAAVDGIVRADGKSSQGTITGYTKTEITLQQGSRETKIPVNDMQRVLWDGEPTALKNARSTEAAGNLTKALEFYKEVQDNPSGLSDEGKKDLQYLMARAQARAALIDPSQADAAIAELEKFKSANSNHFRYYELHEFLGQAYAVKGDADKAKAAFSEMAAAPYNDIKMAARILSADVMLKNKDVSGAEREYAAVAAMTAETPQETRRRNEARLGQAVCLDRQGKSPQAVDLLQQVILETPREDTALQGKAYLRKGDALKSQGQDKKAVMEYLAVDLLFSNQPELHAEALYNLSQLWGKVGSADRASDALARLRALYPNSPWLAQAQ